jgi:hypothetical protein
MLPIHYGATGNANQNESNGLASSSSFKAFYKQLTKPFFQVASEDGSDNSSNQGNSLRKSMNGTTGQKDNPSLSSNRHATKVRESAHNQHMRD